MYFDIRDWLIMLAVPVIAWVVATSRRRRMGQLNSYRGYYLALGQLSTGPVAATYFGANLTFTSIFLILSAESYKRGWVVLWVPLFWILGTLLFQAAYPRIAPHIASSRTLHQTLGHVYDSPTLRKWAAFWTITAFVGTVALEFYGGILLITWTGLPLAKSVAIACFLVFAVIAFTVNGGLRGIATADVFLDIVTFASVVILACWLIPFFSSPPLARSATNVPVRTDNLTFVIAMAVLFLPFQFCTLDSWQRLLAWRGSARNPARWLMPSASVLALIYCVPIAIGVAVRMMNVHAAANQPLIVFVHSMMLSNGFRGLCFAGFAGAVLSTADELLNCTSMSLMADVWGLEFGAVRTQAEQEKLFVSGKFYTIVFGIAAGLLALLTLRFTKEISELALAVFSAQVVFAWPLAAALTTPKTAPRLTGAAVWSMAVAGITAAGLVGYAWWSGATDVADAAPVAAFMVAGLIFGPTWAYKGWRGVRVSAEVK